MRAYSFKEDENWPNWFAMVTRGFVEEYCLGMTRNAWVLYLTLATFYDQKQKRSYPTQDKLFAVCPLSKSSRSRALGELLVQGLVEVWGENRGRRRRTFYRLLHVDAKGHHVAQVQQATRQELIAWEVEGTLPPEYEWVRRAYVKSRRSVCACQ